MFKSTPIKAMRRLQGFEIARVDGTDHEFPPHGHDEFIIGANIIGRENVRLDRDEFDASTDDVTLYNPGQIQSGGSAGSRWVFVSIYVSTEFMLSLNGNGLPSEFQEPSFHSNAFAARVRQFAGLGLDRSFSKLEVTESLVDLLDDLMNVAGAKAQPGTSCTGSSSARVAARLIDDMTADVTLYDLSLSEGLTPVQLVRAFKREFGQPPFAWLATQRLKLARQRLSGGEKPADVAADLGFSDQAHLTRRFRAAYGTTPGAYAQVK